MHIFVNVVFGLTIDIRDYVTYIYHEVCDY